MIFITVGTQEPFDRLIKAVDLLPTSIFDAPVVAQIAESRYKAKNIRTFNWLCPKDFDFYFKQASLIISHAGMGTIISALVYEKPIIVLPRQAKFGEHRNDHQLATAKKFELLHYVHVVYSEDEIKNKINEVLNSDLKSLHTLGKYASENLLTSIKEFIYF